MKIWFSEKFAKIGSCFRKIPEIVMTPKVISALEELRGSKLSDAELEDIKCLMK